jgi:tetratricopeptide (TPR) repeat protein
MSHGCRALAALLTLSGRALLAQAAQPPAEVARQARAVFAKAVELQQQGDLDGAIAAYRSFLELQPKNVEARSNLGAALAHQGRSEEAIDQYRQALALDATRTAVRLNLALALYKSDRIADAATELERVVAERPDQRNAVVLLADCRLRLGEPKKTIAALEPLQASAPDDRAVAYLLGLALIRDHQAAKGQVVIDRILRDGDSAEAHLLMGAARMAAGEYPAARDDFAQAAALRPDLPGVHAYVGRALMATGDRNAAADAFRRELRSNPTDFDSNLLLGALLKEEHDAARAMDHLRKALAVRPGAPEARYQVAAVQLMLGQVEDATRLLEALVGDEPKFVEAHVSLATAYYRSKRKADGDRERALVDQLNREQQAREPGARDDLGAPYRGEGLPSAPPSAPHEVHEPRP